MRLEIASEGDRRSGSACEGQYVSLRFRLQEVAWAS